MPNAVAILVTDFKHTSAAQQAKMCYSFQPTLSSSASNKDEAQGQKKATAAKQTYQ